MKRSFYLFLCVILAALVAVFAVGCNQPPEESETQGHTHAYSGDWSTDANNHWHAATCGCANEKANLGAHADANKDGKCDTCQYVVCAHTYATEWSTDEENHWYAPSCDCDVAGKDLAAHADTDKDGKCDTCEYVICAHAYAAEWSADEENHWHAATCECEIEDKDFGAHVDADRNGKCDTCQYVVCAHTYADAWSTNGTHHWYAATCDCDVKKDYAEHKDANEDGICDDCDGVVCSHTYATELSKDAKGHWYAATCGCDVKGSYEEHDRAVSQSGSVCRDCDYVTCTGHTYDSNYTADANGHFQAATCGCDYEKNRNEHYDDDNDGVCDIEGCAWSDPTHLHTFNGDLWEKNANYHWHPATCEHSGAIMLLDHVDMNKDNVCDACEQIMCYHRYTAGWEYNDTHHWEPADCGCDAEPINYGTHVDANSDGICDVCLKGHTAKEIFAVGNTGTAEFNNIAEAYNYYYTSFTFTVEKAGAYVIKSLDESVTLALAEDADWWSATFFVNGVFDAGETVTVYAQYFTWGVPEDGTYAFDYSAISLEEVVINQNRGSAILPGAIEVDMTFVAPAAGVYILSAPVEGIEWGTWNAEWEGWDWSMEYQYITLEANRAGEEINFRVRNSTTTEGYLFDWTIETSLINYDVEVDDTVEVHIPYGFVSTLTFTPDVTGIYKFSAGYDTTRFGKYNEEYGYLAWSYENIAEYTLIAGKTYTIYLSDNYATVDAVDHITVTLLEEVVPEPETIEVEEGVNEVVIPAGGAYVSFQSYYDNTVLFELANVSSNAFLTNNELGIKVTGNSAWHNLGFTASAEFELGSWSSVSFFVQNNSDEAITVTFTITFIEEIIPEVVLGENFVQNGQYVFTAPADGVYCISSYDMYTQVSDRTQMWVVTGNEYYVTSYPYYGFCYCYNLQMMAGDQVLLMVSVDGFYGSFSITEGENSGYTGPEGGGSNEPVESTLVLGENSVDVTDAWNGVKVTFVAEEAGTYVLTITDENGMIVVEDAYGGTNYWYGDEIPTFTLDAGGAQSFVILTGNWEPDTIEFTIEML